jgi:hypothetical protein
MQKNKTDKTRAHDFNVICSANDLMTTYLCALRKASPSLRAMCCWAEPSLCWDSRMHENFCLALINNPVRSTFVSVWWHFWYYDHMGAESSGQVISSWPTDLLHTVQAFTNVCAGRVSAGIWHYDLDDLADCGGSVGCQTEQEDCKWPEYGTVKSL